MPEKKKQVSAETFSITWNELNGDADEVSRKLEVQKGSVIARYKKYRKAGINLCEMQKNNRVGGRRIVDIVSEINKKLEEVNQ